MKDLFSRRVRELREEKNLKQEQLAERLGVSQSTITHWERAKGIAPPPMLVKLAREFNVSVDYLIGRTDIRHPRIPEWYTKKHGDIPKEDMREYLDYMKATVMDQVRILFANGQFHEEDREALFRDISEIFWMDKDQKKR